MDKHTKIITGLVVSLVVILGVFAMVNANFSDLMSASVLQPSGSACRKVSNTLYKNDLYTDTLIDLNMTWESAAKCGKRYPSLFKKSLRMSIDEDRCSMLRDWLDEGVLSSTATAFRIGNSILTQCAQQFRDIWFDEGGFDNGSADLSETCQWLKQWRDQGVLTPNMQSNGIGWEKIAECSNAYPGIFLGGTSNSSMSDCQMLREWLDAASLSPVGSQYSANLAVMQMCARDFSGIWNNSRRAQGNDYGTVSRNNCQLYQNWIKQSTLTSNLQILGLVLSDRITQCRASFPDVMGVQPQPVAGPSCETVAQWAKQKTLTANLNNLGLDMRSIIGNCGNTCLYKMPTINYEKCDNIALWLRQGNLTPNLQSRGMAWDVVVDCGHYCLSSYFQ